MQVDKIFRNNKYDLIDQQYQQHFQHGLSAEICSENSVEGRVQCEQAKERASGKILNISTFHYEEEIKRLVLLVD